MATLTEMVAAVVVHSSAAAFSHFGVVLETPQVEQRPTPVAEQRIVARSRRNADRPDALQRTDKLDQADKVEKAVICPEAQRARTMKA
jgi:hypothetical protein